MSTFEEIRPEFEISSKVETVARYGFEGIYPLYDSGVGSATVTACHHYRPRGKGTLSKI